jgi:hypothetical protein
VTGVDARRLSYRFPPWFQRSINGICGALGVDFTYTYPTTANTGRISQMADNIIYDQLNRLVQSASNVTGRGCEKSRISGLHHSRPPIEE